MMDEEPAEKERDTGHSEALRPAAPKDAPHKSRWVAAMGLRKRGAGPEHLVMQFCVALAVAVLAMAVIFFAGFAENDQGVFHLLSALAMSLGLASLAWFPLVFVFYFAWQRQKSGKRLHPLKTALTLLVLLPWLITGFYLLPLGGLARAGGVLSVVSSVILSIWALRSGRKIADR